MNELEFIASVRRRMHSIPSCGEGIGDDCAIMPQDDGMAMVVTCDMLTEGVHFRLDTTTPRLLGHKALAVNLSDVASMGASPVASFMSIARPGTLSDSWCDSFLDGYARLSERFGVPLMGGDTTASEHGLAISVTLIGRARYDHVKRRSAAGDSDVIMVGGTLGDSAAGLRLLQHNPALAHELGLDVADAPVTACHKNARLAPLVEAHLAPMPQTLEGRWLGERCEVHAMTDISDGIAKDLRQITDMSAVGASVELSQVPLSQELTEYCLSEGVDPVRMALCGGEDYKLLFTVDCHKVDRLTSDFRARFGYEPVAIGRITQGEGIEWLRCGVPTDEIFSGYVHE